MRWVRTENKHFWPGVTRKTNPLGQNTPGEATNGHFLIKEVFYLRVSLVPADEVGVEQQ